MKNLMRLRKKSKKYFQASSNMAQAVLRAYQCMFSPDHGIFAREFGYQRCRFFPSCSEYAAEAIRQYGLMRGVVLSLKRIIRCNPFANGGIDYVQSPKK